MEYFAAIDVSMEGSKVCVVEGSGVIVREGSCESDPSSLGGLLAGWGLDYARVGLEAGPLSHWLHAGLRGLGYGAVLLETRQAHAVLEAMGNKTDRKDARGLAQLLRTGWYREVHAKSVEAQDVRALLTARQRVLTSLVQVENSIRGLVKTAGARLGRGRRSDLARRARAAAAAMPLLAEGIEALLAVHATLRRELARLSKRVVALAGQDAAARRLMTVPGVGALTALAFVATIDEPARFTHSRSVGAHLGLTPKRYQSGEMDRSGRISKCGDGLLRSLLFEAATVLLTRVRRWSSLKAWGMAIAKRRGMGRARVAVARKLAVILHRMLADGGEFRWSAA